MKLCGRHEADLIHQLKRKNLWKFCTNIPALIEERTVKWLDGMAAPSEVDPLIICLLEINKKAEEFCGAGIVLPKANGQPHCALCEVGKLICNKADIEWTDNITDAVLSLCLQNGVMNPSGILQ